jgi:hypothetical protein
MEKEIEIWYSEYELRQFIDMAFRWKIEGIYNNRTENRPFSEFTHFVENARDNFELFSTQLNKKLTKTENWKAIEIDLKDRFLPMIEGYLNWYEQNKAELVKFEPYCPYTIMLSIIESTKAEILKYFPQNNKPLPPEQTETKTDKLKAPVLGLFCKLINENGIDEKDDSESATVYCKRICDKFKLPYTDRVRQNYKVKETKKLIQELNEKVLPLIDDETKNLIGKYLDSKQPPKQNLYA